MDRKVEKNDKRDKELIESLFNKVTYNGLVKIKAEEIKTGDLIYLTTSDFEWDCGYGCFINNLRGSIDVRVEILNEDLSEYVPGKHSDGGCYAYATARVVEVL